MSTEQPVLIIGAGVTGLTLAQTCQKRQIPFQIFERDDSAVHSQHRTVGKGLTEGFGLHHLKAALPDELASRLPECHVDQAAVEFGVEGHYDVLDLSTAGVYQQKRTEKRIRLSREKLRALLLTDIEVRWSKTLTEISGDDDSAKATFSDGTSETGSMLIGCDGANSTVDRILHPEGHKDEREIGLRILLATANYPASEVAAIRNLEPFFVYCVDPKPEVLLRVNFLERSSDEDPHSADDTVKCQIALCWPYESDWLGRVDPTDVPNTKIGQRALFRHLSESWAEPFRSFIQNMPRDADIQPVNLTDGFLDMSAGFGGRATLAGQAAKPLSTPFGDGGESSMNDIYGLTQSFLEPLYGEDGDGDGDGEKEFDFKGAREQYEGLLQEMVLIEALS